MIETSKKQISSFPRFLLVLSVPFALFLMILLGYLNYIPLKVEMHSLVIIFIIFLMFVSFINHNSWVSFANFKNLLPKVLEEVDDFLYKNQLILAQKKKAFGNIEPFFQNHLRSIRNDNFASIATSIFPTLGILGTFTAIAISMPNFTVDSKEALENEITVLLSGVGTAFYASIYGIFLSIWWIFFEKRGMTKIQNELNDIKIQYKQFLWDKEEIEVYKTLETQEKNQRFLEKIQSVISPEYVESLDNIAKQRLSQIKLLDEEFRNSEQRISKSYEELIKLFENTSKKQEELLENYKEISSTVNKTNESFENMSETQEKNTKALKSEIYSVLSSFELVSSDLKSLGKDLVNGK